MNRLLLLMAAGLAVVLAGRPACAADKFYVYNLTTSTDFTGVYLAPTGTAQPDTGQWGRNQALNDSDHALNVTERLLLTGIGHKVYDVRLVDKNGRVCVKHGVDLTREKTFDVREADLADCK